MGTAIFDILRKALRGAQGIQGSDEATEHLHHRIEEANTHLCASLPYFLSEAE